MKHIYKYNEFVDESYFPVNKKEIKEKLKQITDKEQLKDYLGSLFDESEKMNKRFKRFFISTVVVVTLSITGLSLSPNDIKSMAKTESTKEIVEEELNQLPTLLDSIAWKESTNRPHVVNRLGYIGKYQFHDLALIDAGVADNKKDAKAFRKKFINSSKEDRLKMWSESEQDTAMVNLMKKNKHYLRNYSDYIGDTIQNIPITWSGVLSASHLGGQGNVKKFLKSDGKNDYADANGVKVSDYLSKFANYRIDL